MKLGLSQLLQAVLSGTTVANRCQALSGVRMQPSAPGVGSLMNENKGPKGLPKTTPEKLDESFLSAERIQTLVFALSQMTDRAEGHLGGNYISPTIIQNS